MKSRDSSWFWKALWGFFILLGVGITWLYAWLPVDGASSDLTGFTDQGFQIQWLIRKQAGDLQVGDVILSAGGHTVDEWLNGAPRGSEWKTGGVVSYQVLREGQTVELAIPLSPFTFREIINHWGPQLIGAVIFFLIGSLVFWKRPQELPARLLMLFSLSVATQFLGDAYNFQFGTLPWRWPLWFHLGFKFFTFSLAVASLCTFSLVFPKRHPLFARHPALVSGVIFGSHPVVITVAMILSPTWSSALRNGGNACLVLTLFQVGIAIAAGIRSSRTAQDPVSRAQVQWIVWTNGLGIAVMVPGYVMPLLWTGHPWLPHPIITLVVALMSFSLAIAILRYHLFDIEIIINRTLVYGSLTALLFITFFLLVRFFTLVVEITTNRKDNVAVVFMATVVVALLFSPLRARIQTLIDRAFYRTQIDYEKFFTEVSGQIATHILPGQLLALLVEVLPRQLQITSARLAVLDLPEERWVDKGHRDLLRDHPFVQFISKYRRPIRRLNPRQALPAGVKSFLESEQIELSIPLIIGEKMVGVYHLGAKRSGHAYNRNEIKWFTRLGQQIAIAIENSRLLQAEQRQRNFADALQKAAAIVSSTLDIEQVLDRILEQVERVVEGDAFNIMLIRGKLVQVVRWRGYEKLGIETSIPAPELSVDSTPTIQHMLMTGEPLVIPDTHSSSDWVTFEGWQSIRSFMAAPIKIARKPVGFLNVDGTRPYQFSHMEVLQLEAFAHHAAIALQNARLYARIKKSLEEKDVLLKEIHHRVKNNLQIISSLLNLQTGAEAEPQPATFIQESQNRIRSIALIHEKLYRADDLTQIDFGEYVHSLTRYLFRAYGNLALIQLSIHAENILLDINTAIPCGLLLNELVSNALKHAFPEGQRGEIQVIFRSLQNRQLELKVRDTGVGLPANLETGQGHSTGFQLVEVLARQLGGTLKIDRRYGTSIQVTFAPELMW